jgi:YVTN family beta-propeller protein
VLRVDPDDVDALRFECLLDEGRRAFGGGDAARASSVLSAALALWRGPPLGLTFEEGERANVARLEELRLEALEIRIDADLALGRHDRLVPELELLAARHPLRERLHRQRMLALYRCGRQPEALAVYRETRARLVDELGIEPTAAMRELHDAMLRQDAALDLTGDGAPAPAGRAAGEAGAEPGRTSAEAAAGPSRRRLPAIVAALALIAGVAVVVTLLARSTGAPPAVRIPANAVGVLDPKTGRVVATVAVGLRPSSPVEAGGSVWVANLDDATVSRIDSGTMRLQETLTPGGSVTGITAGGGALWVGDATSALVRRVAPAVGAVTRTTALPGGITGPQGTDVQEPLAFGAHSLWAGHRGTVTRLDARGSRRETIPIGLELVGIALGADTAWVTDDLDNNVSQIVGGTVVARIPVGQGPSGIAVGAGAVWVAQRFDGTVARIDRDTARVTDTIPVGREPVGVAVLGDSVWIANSGDGTLSRIDARAGRVIDTVPVGGSPTGVAAIGGRLWVSVQAPAAAVTAPAPLARRGGVVRFDRTETLDTLNDSLDPALAYNTPSWQILYATCAKLYNEPDAPGAAGTRIVPEIARGRPEVSAGGLRQTFTVRPGFRLSPPSGAPVTAQTFRHAIERSVDPRWHTGTPAMPYLEDVVGARAFEQRDARHIAGVSASGDRLVIRTTRPAPDLALRLSMPFFCAVPDDAPVRRGGIWTLPMAGPYYIRSVIRGRQVVLARNPNYHGPRPAHADAIDLRLGVPAATAVARVAAGTDDYTETPGGFDTLPAPLRSRLHASYGTALGPVRRRFLVNESSGEYYLALNTARPLFANARLRRAASFAIDRAALAAQTGPRFSPMHPTDQYLAPSIPGFRDASLYPLHGDTGLARRLAGAGHRHANLIVPDFAPFTKWAAIVRADLARIGIDVTVHALSPPAYTKRLGDRNARYDIAFFGWFVDFPDPHNVLDQLARGKSYSFFDDPVYNRRLDAAARLNGPARYAAYDDLDRDLAGRESPIIAFAIPVQGAFFSARIGCQVFQSGGGWIDLATLCLKHG